MSAVGLNQALASLKETHRYRSLMPRRGLDFSSFDYLALSQHPDLRQHMVAALQQGVAFGAGDSRLLAGHYEAHIACEETAARFFNAEQCLLFNSGYIANFALLTTLPTRHDVILFDESIHASSKEGIHASHAKYLKFKHNDAGDLEEKIKRARAQGAKQLWIVVESIYSMSGDIAPLAVYAGLASTYDVMLIIDEAHATGVYGEGRGLSANMTGDHIIKLHTCGKALALSGALLSASCTIIDYLINHARPFIYSTAPSPLLAGAISKAIRIVEQEPQLGIELHKLTEQANALLAPLSANKLPGTHIIPLIVGNDEHAVTLADALSNQGFDVRAIRPPTVREGCAQLRITITRHITVTDLKNLVCATEALQEVLMA